MSAGRTSSELARALNDILQVTSGDDTLRVLPDESRENTVLPCTIALVRLVSSITSGKLSLSITVRAGSTAFCDCCCNLSLRRVRARSPNEGPSSCALSGKARALSTSNTIPGILSCVIPDARSVGVEAGLRPAWTWQSPVRTQTDKGAQHWPTVQSR